MKLLSKKIEGQEMYGNCDICGEEVTLRDVVEILGQEVAELSDSQDEIITIMEKVGDVSLETDELMYKVIKDLKNKIDMIVDHLGLEFSTIPATEEKKVLIKKSKKK